MRRGYGLVVVEYLRSKLHVVYQGYIATMRYSHSTTLFKEGILCVNLYHLKRRQVRLSWLRT